MLMRSYSHTPQITVEMANKVFEDYKDYHGEFDYSVELVDAVLDGRIRVDKPFNLFGWCKTVKEGKYQMDLRRLKKEEYLIDDDDEQTGVKASSLVDTRDDYEKIDDSSELEDVVERIKGLQYEIAVDIGVDIIFCMRRAVQGITAAVEELGRVCREYEWIGEYIQVILSSGVSFNELFPPEITEFYEPRKRKSIAYKAS